MDLKFIINPKPTKNKTTDSQIPEQIKHNIICEFAVKFQKQTVFT